MSILNFSDKGKKMPEESRELQLRSTQDLQTSIAAFSQPLASYLEALGLPTEDVLYPMEQRGHVIAMLGQALEVLPIDQRSKASYLSKFTVAIAAGLFDGALNYLWDETVAALRRLVLKFDLQYFFSVAEKVNARNRGLTGEEELDQVADHDLLNACRRIGLVSDVNYQRLEHINYMRNHASAAHPNENEISGFEVLSWLTNCLRYAITAEPEHSVIQVKRLLENIRAQAIPPGDAPLIGTDIAKLSQERIDDLLLTLAGMFTDPRLDAHAKANIANIAPHIWPASSENRKYEIGSRFGVYRKNGDVPRKDLAGEFLDLVGGQRYKDEDSLAGELMEKLEVLRRVHFGFNNFYNESPHAKLLSASLPKTGLVPRAARPLWVKVISLGFIGNGLGFREGVDEAAVQYYDTYIRHFTEAEVVEFLQLVKDPEFTSELSHKKPDRRMRALATMVKGKHLNIHIQRALEQMIGFPTTLDRIAATGEYKRVLESLPKHA